MPATGSANPLAHTIYMLVRTNPAWLALEPKARFAFFQTEILPTLKATPSVTMRFFESEAYNARVTDILVWETADLPAYWSIVERLRETPFWGHYFEIVEILPSVENAYVRHYGVDLLAPAG